MRFFSHLFNFLLVTCDVINWGFDFENSNVLDFFDGGFVKLWWKLIYLHKKSLKIQKIYEKSTKLSEISLIHTIFLSI